MWRCNTSIHKTWWQHHSNSRVSCQKGPSHHGHAYAWQIGPFWQDTLHIDSMYHSYRRWQCTEHNNYNDKTYVRFALMNDTPYLTLNCVVSFMSYTKKNDRDTWTHYGLMTPYGGMDLRQHWFRLWMACCLTAPSHYLNLCWFIVSKVQWHSSEGNFTRDTSATNR